MFINREYRVYRYCVESNLYSCGSCSHCCDDYSKEIESLRNYIRLLEKENQELKEGK